MPENHFPKKELVEGVDYYFNEEGLMVFTEAYHLARGYCCQSGCKHCPYGPEGESEEDSGADKDSTS